ncbi:glucan ABC transporter ATP-binding protein/ permease [Pseudoroseomonas ludipueritiae]|uniref:Glucan ABC transporter ATP-binding protein/ permease n=1 Tax=Pseudoroseomonas ludipueritiae TaxID=198093 RepID=A0ABR7R698_9PROT|nr:glucan ABC transporter ATP-binding protein/ permease [Pseudoroseomonas ludipueritiae]MBC9177194.1 glucan ABC transporter ATP-binding protein/ permease [Pseudoroseomonas ludipueritiae]MCG7363378.1 glucan ABC transporter ATP-binding protein/ permease [Roseomonas sp. ACRSG]
MGFFKVYARALGLLKPDRAVASGLALLALACAALQFLEPVLFGRVIDLLSRGSGQSTLGVLLVWGAAGLAGIGCNAAIALLSDRMAHRNRLAVMQRYYQHVLAMPPAFHGDTQSGRLMKVMQVGADSLSGLWLSFFRDHLVTALAVGILLPMSLVLNWRLGLLLVGLVVLFCTVAGFVISRTHERQAEVEELHSRLAGNAQDALSNILVVQSFARLQAESRLFGGIVRQVLERQMPVLNWWAALSIMTRSASTLCVMAIFALGAWLNGRGLASLGEIVSFMGFALLLIGRLEGLVGFVARLVLQKPALEELFAVIDTESTVPDRPQALAMGRVRGEVRFEDVGFSYPNAHPAIAAVSFTAEAGRSIALVGHTGAGKSTAMALLQRLWDPSAGRITIDGLDLRDMTLESLRQNIGVVFQDNLLFNRSIRENLLVGRPEATQEEIEQACRMAEAHDFILRQPQGYDTPVGERGVALSGGQKQRLAIARALLKNPPILILDEATSALDAATEARVQKALKALMAGRTTFIIAHRLSTIREADEILVFESGRVVERGDFDSLVHRGGTFAELVRSQMPAPLALVA